MSISSTRLGFSIAAATLSLSLICLLTTSQRAPSNNEQQYNMENGQIDYVYIMKIDAPVPRVMVRLLLNRDQHLPTIENGQG